MRPSLAVFGSARLWRRLQVGSAGGGLGSQHDSLVPKPLLTATALEVLGLHLLPCQGWTTPIPLAALQHC